MDVLGLADKLWRGEVSTTEQHPWAVSGGLVEVAEGVGFLPGFANVTALAAGGSLVLVDTGSPMTAAWVHEQVRGWTRAPLHTAVYSHGHIDHVFGVGRFEAEADRPARVVAHAALPRRFDRYRLTAGYNAVVNARQFQAPGLSWPTEYRYPDVTYDAELALEVDDLRLELVHARGETDDHTWTWLPQRRVLCCGDLFIWACPNAGNPQKVQRYPAEWAAALRRMAVLGAEVLLPGHGVPVVGTRRVHEALTDTAALLQHLHDETVALMNAGAGLDEILHSVRAPDDLIAKPYLQPVYDEPEFIVRNVWRLYGGWHDGDPARLKPAPAAELAAEIARLAGGVSRLVERAAELSDSGEHRLACHLAELAVQAAPDDPAAHGVRAAVYGARLTAETSTMAKGIYAAAAAESAQRSGGAAP